MLLKFLLDLCPMKIRLENAVPAPLADWDSSRSEVWNTKLEIQQGELVQVQAASGKGKSTLIQMIYGNRKDYSGQVFIDDQPINNFNHVKWAELRQSHLSIMFQDLRLFPDLTGWENIQLKLRLNKYTTKEHIEEMATRLGVIQLFGKKAGIMSYGERQRMAIVRALVQPFDFILLDEPFSHLDQTNTAKAAELINEEVAKRKAGLIIACLDEDHDLNYTRKVKL